MVVQAIKKLLGCVERYYALPVQPQGSWCVLKPLSHCSSDEVSFVTPGIIIGQLLSVSVTWPEMFQLTPSIKTLKSKIANGHSKLQGCSTVRLLLLWRGPRWSLSAELADPRSRGGLPTPSCLSPGSGRIHLNEEETPEWTRSRSWGAGHPEHLFILLPGQPQTTSVFVLDWIQTSPGTHHISGCRANTKHSPI